MIRQYELVDLVRSYSPELDEDALNRAYVYAMKMHGAQQRASGDPYFSHPLEVARILTEMRLDTASIITALLHDTLEDTPATYDELESIFGGEIARLVDGVTKLSRIELQSPDSKQAENFRKLILAMSEDIRVLLVKLADRLHNLRTLNFIANPDKRKRIAHETLEIYAPLAERMGIHAIKDELEDLSFAELNPEGRASVTARLDYLRAEGGGLVQEIMAELSKLFDSMDLMVRIEGREKSPISIWRKMERKRVAFEQLSDVMAFRILVGTMGDCYAVLGAVHGAYSMVPGRFKDYISTPKPNGYRSLHTTIIGPKKQRIEVQIRTEAMHQEAEWGVAAHWAYKQKQRSDGRQYRWLRELLDILDQAHKPDEFLEHTKLELFRDEVFCFTPKGDLISLPRGATPVDFAYAVHSEVGDRTVGAKVNGNMVPLNAVLNNGDQVEILTSKSQTPSPTWERFVVTGKARARIRRFIRLQERDQYATLGKAMLQKLFRHEGYDFSEKAVAGVLTRFSAPEVEDLYAAVGSGAHTAREVFGAIFPGHKATATDADQAVLKHQHRPKKPTGKGQAVPIKGLIPGLAVHFAGCCHPLPGDRIVGIVTTGKGVTIHTIDCETLEHFHATPERWLDVAWNDDVDDPDLFIARLHTIIYNEPGSLGTLSTVIGKNDGNITNLKVVSRSLDFWEMLLDVQVRDKKHLSHLMAALRASPHITSVERAQTH